MPDARRPNPDVRSSTPDSSLSRWVPVALYMAFIFGLSSLTATPAMPGGSDKLLHALLYAGFGLLLARAFAGGWRGVTWITVLTVTACGALYGISDEVHQYFNPPRAVEMADVVADTIGSAAGAAALRAWGIIRGRDGL